MFSTTIKRSVGALGVVAGLLAAAGPASAQLVDGTVLAKAGPQPGSKAPAATVLDHQGSPLLLDIVIAPTFKGEVIGLEPNALGTQVGSEGVKAPAKTLPTWTEGNNQPSGDNLRGEAIDIIP